MKASLWVIWVVVFAGIAAVSSASLFIKMAAAPPLTVAAYRVTIATLLLLFFRFFKNGGSGELKKLSLMIVVASGFCLAAHFVLWITSLNYTSVAVSVSLVNTSPIFVALMSVFFLGERPGSIFWIGLIAALVGSSFLVRYESLYGPGSITGAILALAGAIALAGYLLMGRYALKLIPFRTYILFVYGTASVMLLGICILSGTPLKGFSKETYLFLILIGLVPQLIGHSAFNWALQHLPAFVVSVLILGEPIGATVLARLFLNEEISPGQVAGLVILSVGLVVCTVSASTHSVDRGIQTR